MTEPEHDLDEMFAAARRHAPRPDGALLGRIAADAARLAPRRGWGRLWRDVGGWWSEGEIRDRVVVRVLLSDGAIVDLAREGGAWSLVGTVD